jgi:hypothetical protein
MCSWGSSPWWPRCLVDAPGAAYGKIMSGSIDMEITIIIGLTLIRSNN